MRLLFTISALAACGGRAGGAGDSAAGVTDTGVPSGGDGGHSDTAAPLDGGGVDSGGDTGSTLPPPPDPFELQVSTSPDPVLGLWSNLPRDLADCLAVDATDTPCLDDDDDGLVDAWEQIVLDRLSPVVRLDEDEPMMVDADAVFAGVGRVTADGGALRVYMMLGYSSDYGRCEISAHDGDSERVALALDGVDAESVVVVGAYTAAHEGEVTDAGSLLAADELDQMELATDLSTGEARWRVYASEGKHATYMTADACESASWVPCLEEDCGPDGAGDPTDFDLWPTVLNAGEPDHPLADDLAGIGFADESAWADQTFCGGRGRGDGCASAVREKLVDDPF